MVQGSLNQFTTDLDIQFQTLEQARDRLREQGLKDLYCSVEFLGGHYSSFYNQRNIAMAVYTDIHVHVVKWVTRTLYN